MAEEEKTEVKDVFWCVVAPSLKKKSHQETTHLFTYARLRQMLNNSSREADNTQLYLGYGGAWVLSLPGFCTAQIIGITLQAEEGKAKLGHFA